MPSLVIHKFIFYQAVIIHSRDYRLSFIYFSKVSFTAMLNVGKIYLTRTLPYLPKKSAPFCVFGFMFLYPVRMDDQMFSIKSSQARDQLHGRVAKTLLSTKATLANQFGLLSIFLRLF